jgi:uncharacterized OB-fold protein
VSDSSNTVAIAPGLFRVDGDRPLLVGIWCATCGQRAFPATDTCPWCGSTSVTPTDLATTGTLWAWTSVTAAPPGYSGRVPYGFGVVQLDDGVRVITRLTESDPDALTFGEPVRLVLEAVDRDDEGRDVVTWAFEVVR